MGPAIAVSASLTSVDLRNNQLMGSSDWSEHKTEDGEIFYHNQKTNESVWTRPDPSSGITAIADAIRVSASLTNLS